MVEPGLENGQPHYLGVVEQLGLAENTQAVDHELLIVVGKHLNAAAQLEVDDVDVAVGHDNHVSGAETALHILGGVDPLLYGEDGVLAAPPRLLDLALDEGNILVHGLQQLVRVVVGHGTAGALLEVLLDEVFGHRMACGTLGGVGALLILELLLQHQGGGAVQAAVRSRGGKSRVSGRHQSASTSRRRSA